MEVFVAGTRAGGVLVWAGSAGNLPTAPELSEEIVRKSLRTLAFFDFLLKSQELSGNQVAVESEKLIAGAVGWLMRKPPAATQTW